MTDSYAAELHDILDRAYEIEHSGRATSMALRESLHRDLPEHMAEHLVAKGIAAEVRRYLSEKDADGLPKRPAVNDEDEHVQLDFASVTEFAYVHAAYKSREAQNSEKADKVRQRCIELHGVDVATLEVAS